MSFSSNLALWLGSAPNALQAGRVDCYVGANNDKTGYSLTAGSYSVRASSTQYGTMSRSGAGTSATLTISAVTVARTTLHLLGFEADSSTGQFNRAITRHTLTNTTTVTATCGYADAGTTVSSVCVAEWF